MRHIEKQDRLDYLAYYDDLTGLANRPLFLERVALYVRSAASAGHRLAVCFIDLERFKNINDSFGRSMGDALLTQGFLISQALPATLFQARYLSSQRALPAIPITPPASATHWHPSSQTRSNCDPE